MSQTNIAFQGEIMLLNWAESSTRGRTATFLLSEDGESHPFKDFTIRQGKRAGQRFMAVLVQIDDNEQPVQQPQQRLSQTAAVMCKDPEFWTWSSSRTFDPVNSEETARRFMLDLVGIQSRGDLDRDASSADRFNRLVLVPFNAHRQFFTPTL